MFRLPASFDLLVQIAGRRRSCRPACRKILPEMALVRVEGLEPPSFWHLDLNQACLPIPPHPLKGPAGPESACFYIIRGMVFKRILPGKPVFSGRGRYTRHPPTSVASPMASLPLNDRTRSIHFLLMLRCTNALLLCNIVASKPGRTCLSSHRQRNRKNRNKTKSKQRARR